MRRSLAPSIIKPDGKPLVKSTSFRPVTQVSTAVKTPLVSPKPATATSLAATTIKAPVVQPKFVGGAVSKTTEEGEEHSSQGSSQQTFSQAVSSQRLSQSEAPLSQPKTPPYPALTTPKVSPKATTIFRSPVLASTPQDIHAAEDDELRYYNVVWRTITNKKHKNWNGDGESCLFFSSFLFSSIRLGLNPPRFTAILIVLGRTCQLKDMDGKE